MVHHLAVRVIGAVVVFAARCVVAANRCPVWSALRTQVGHRAMSALISGSDRRYSITLSARSNSAAGTVTPIAFAVLRLITSSNFVGRSTGTSATLAPRNSLMIC
jgi:hypothetical protein